MYVFTYFIYPVNSKTNSSADLDKNSLRDRKKYIDCDSCETVKIFENCKK